MRFALECRDSSLTTRSTGTRPNTNSNVSTRKYSAGIRTPVSTRSRCSGIRSVCPGRSGAWRRRAMAESAGTIWWRPETETTAAIPGVAGKSLAFGGLVVFTVVLLLSPQTFLPLLKTIRIALLAAVVAIGAHAMVATVRHEPVTPSGTETSITVALLGWTVLTLPFSIWPVGSFLLLTDQYVKALVFFWMIAALVTDRARLITLVWSLTVCSIPLAVSALVHFAKGDFLSTGTSIQRIEGYAGLSGNPNDLALTLNLLIPFTGALLFTTRSWLGRTVAACALFVSIPAVIVTFSRAGFLTLVAIGLMGAICFLRRGAVLPAIGVTVVA